MSFYRDIFCCYTIKFFRESVSELGFIFTLFFYFVCSLLFLLLSPFLVLAFPVVFFNEKSKSWFK